MKFIIFAMFFLLCGCTTNLYYHGETKEGISTSPEVVFVTNNEHPNYRILKESGIYEISSDQKTSKKLTILDSEEYLACGMPMLSAIYTLGILPGHVNASELFSYQIEENGSSQIYKHRLSMHETMSIWEFFVRPFKNRDKTKIKALKNSKRITYDPKNTDLILLP